MVMSKARSYRATLGIAIAIAVTACGSDGQSNSDTLQFDSDAVQEQLDIGQIVLAGSTAIEQVPEYDAMFVLGRCVDPANLDECTEFECEVINFTNDGEEESLGFRTAVIGPNGSVTIIGVAKPPAPPRRLRHHRSRRQRTH
jgi:hypothetical protein